MLTSRALLDVRDESGSIVVVAGIIVVAFALLAGGMLQIGDWLQHRRHAQMRVDAAALAGGQLFGQCFDSSKFSTAQAQTNIEDMAKHYMGFASGVSGAPLNTQFGGGSDQYAFQSKTYPDGSQSDDTDTRGECTNMALDVKLQDSNIPSLMKLFPGTTIHAHARVQAQTIQQFKGSFPLAIPDVQPKYVAVTFVNESNGSELQGCGGSVLTGTSCTYLLSKQAPASNLNPWTASVSPRLPAASVSQGSTAGGVQIGARVGMGAVAGSCANTAGNNNWSCFDANSSSIGAEFIRDYSSATASAKQPAAPVLRTVIPSNSCSGAFPSQFGSSPFVSDADNVTSCSVGVSARVDFGTGATDPTKAAAAGGVKAVLTATIAGSTISLSPVAGSYDSTPGSPTFGTWLWQPSSGSAALTVDATGGNASFPVTLAWQEQDGSEGGNACKASGNKCKGTFDNGNAVMRFTSATDAADGPIKLMAITQGSGSAYSLTPGLDTLSVEVRLAGSLGVVNPPVLQALRLTGSGSRTTAVGCDGPGDSQFVAAIVNGCQTPYQINNSQICPDPSPPAGPADCVPTKTGNLGNTVIKAMNTRFAGCPPNNWPDYSQPGDPRVIVMMITDFSAYNGQGKTQVPVVDFAAFYVIGWTGNSCGAAWPFPGKEPNGGNIWGYFVKYASLDQVPSGQVCDPTQITPCVPVLVR